MSNSVKTSYSSRRQLALLAEHRSHLGAVCEKYRVTLTLTEARCAYYVRHEETEDDSSLSLPLLSLMSWLSAKSILL